MIRTIIFDLSEVLIAGLIGIEKPLSAQLNAPEEEVLAAFAGQLLEDLCCGRMSEDSYLARILEDQRWDVDVGALKQAIRQNLHHRVPDMEGVLSQLATRYELVLLSDHAVEWVEHVRAVHPFLGVFDTQVFSFETGQLKREVSTFRMLLRAIDRKPEECVFIDDNPLNVQVASEAGIAGIEFVDAKQLVSGLRSLSVLL